MSLHTPLPSNVRQGLVSISGSLFIQNKTTDCGEHRPYHTGHEVMSSVPLQMALYFNVFFFPFWFISELIMLELKEQIEGRLQRWCFQLVVGSHTALLLLPLIQNGQASKYKTLMSMRSRFVSLWGTPGPRTFLTVPHSVRCDFEKRGVYCPSFCPRVGPYRGALLVDISRGTWRCRTTLNLYMLCIKSLNKSCKK
ncbi:transmembrane protein 17B-like isoform X3 [Lithobates pipiens]